ncbi:hypothetical protein QTP88_020356 [Uroleucon formosanum]
MELLTSLDNFTIYDPYHYSFTHLNTNGICFQFKTSTVQLKIMLNIRDVFISTRYLNFLYVHISIGGIGFGTIGSVDPSENNCTSELLTISLFCNIVFIYSSKGSITMHLKKKKTPISRQIILILILKKELELDPRAKFMSDIHYVICDKFIAELNKRKMTYIEVEEKFGFLFNKNPDRKEIINQIKNLQSMYRNKLDLDPDNFADEWLQFHSLISSHQILINPAAQLKFIKDMQISHAFQNVETFLQIFLTMPVTNCSSERSFSSLKIIKNRLQSKLSQENIDALGILSIESDITANLNFDDVIDHFSKQKARKYL